MKKFFIVLIFYSLFFINSLFASFDVSLNVDKNELDINDVLNISIELSSTDELSYNIEDIKGLDNFEIVQQSKSTQYQNINGDTSIITNINLSLKAKDVGNYTLGPVILSEDGSIKEYGESRDIEITGAKVFVGENEDINLQGDEEKQTSLDSSPTEEREQEQDISILDGEETKSEEKEVLDLEGNPMTDIYDIKRNLFGSPINFVWTLFYITFFVIVYILYNYYLKSQEVNKLKKVSIKAEKKEIDFKALILALEKKEINLEKEAFYGKLGEFMRLYLDDRIEKGLSTKTLKELKLAIDNSLYTLVEKVYFPEYDGKDDSIENRREVISEFKKII